VTSPPSPPPGSLDARQPITELLLSLRAGRSDAMTRLFPLVYEELRRIAHCHLLGQGEGHTLDTTGLVHEAYLRMVDQTRVEWNDRRHFYAAASRAMRHILVDHARRHNAVKRGGGRPVLELVEGTVAVEERAELLVALDEALQRLEALDERLGRVVECRFFGGLTEEETAEVLGVTSRTVRRDWTKAKGWLYRELSA
jgi:RNA polymerase sigma factor (TIGR02999 family)